MNYKNQRINIGSSDIAELKVVTMENCELKVEKLQFGEDGDYKAYIVKQKIDEEAIEIPKHYKKVLELKEPYYVGIFDDLARSWEFDKNMTRCFGQSMYDVTFWRAGDFGLIIEIIEV